jgi:hypothetical protein
MALVVGIDTYITLADAVTYIDAFVEPGGGADLSESDLRQATLALDRLYGGRMHGRVTSSQQPLQFPRDGSDIVPACVAQATAELAYLTLNGLNPYTQPAAATTKTSFEVPGAYKESNEYASAYWANPLYKVSLILSPVLYGAGGAFTLIDVVRG